MRGRKREREKPVSPSSKCGHLDHSTYEQKKLLEKVKHKLIRGEICVANLIPPANGAPLGNCLVPKMLFEHCNLKNGASNYSPDLPNSQGV